VKSTFLRFVSNSVFLFAFDFFLLFILHSILDVELRIAVAASFTIAFTLSFCINTFWVFGLTDLNGKSLFRFMLLTFGNLLLQVLGVQHLSQIGFNYLLAKIIVVALLFILNFEISRRFIFSSAKAI
jgi:putative flippase GtrA